MRGALLALLLLFIGEPLLAAWGPRGCAPVGALAQAPSAEKVEWEFRPESPGLGYCYVNGTGRGVFDYGSGQWKDFNARTGSFGVWRSGAPYSPPAKPMRCGCSAECRCGATCKCAQTGTPCCATCGCGQTNMGVDTTQMNGAEPKITRQGRSVTRSVALQAIGAKPIPDDSNKRFITVIGTADERKALIDSLPAELASKYIVNQYDRDDWHVAKYGFKSDGHPTVYIEEPNGQVLHRQDEPAGFAEALRKADPNYDPKLDPDLRRRPGPLPRPPAPPQPCPLPEPDPEPGPDFPGGFHGKSFGFGIGAGGTILLLLRYLLPLILKFATGLSNVGKPTPEQVEMLALVKRMHASLEGRNDGSNQPRP